MKHFWSFLIAIVLFVGNLSAKEPVEWVNPFIGTTNYGTTFPGPTTPNGLMSVSPFNVMGSEINRHDKDTDWWSTPYDNNNSYLTGFSHVNLSGVGCPDLGSLLVMATTGDLDVDYHNYGSTYNEEVAAVGYYAVVLDKYNIRAEATATTRTSRLRFNVPAGRANILLNLGEGLTNETGASVRRISETEIVGSKLLGTFCYNSQAVFPIYFALRVEKKPVEQGFWKFQRPKKGIKAQWDADNGRYKLYPDYGRVMSGDDIGVWYTFDAAEGEQIEVSLAVSFVSEDNARLNLDTEQPAGTTFDQIRAQARKSWNDVLSRIIVEGGNDDQMSIFYTALYHALIHPNILQDVNGQYPAMQSNDVRTTDGNRYTVFSLWDTYRNVHQLLTLVYPERQLEMVRSMVDMSKEWGWLPKWELFGRETYTMDGDPAIPVIVDTWRKGLRDFDIDAAYKAMKRSATTPGSSNPIRPDIDSYIARNYIPLGEYAADNSGDNSVSHALEYYVADNALAWLAQERGDLDFAAQLRTRAAGWRNYYCPEYGCLRPLNADGTFLAPFDPLDGQDFGNAPGFHEGSAWNYTFYVPHQIHELAEAMGGDEAFLQKLYKVFSDKLYDPTNEPNIAYPYLFTHFKGAEKITDQIIHNTLKEFYHNTPYGIPGNDDTGTMSAWAVFSMIGLYPDVPGEPEYALVEPTFNRIELRLPGRKPLLITKSAEASAITLDGKPVGRRITHQQLLNASNLIFKHTIND